MKTESHITRHTHTHTHTMARQFRIEFIASYCNNKLRRQKQNRIKITTCFIIWSIKVCVFIYGAWCEWCLVATVNSGRKMLGMLFKVTAKIQCQWQVQLPANDVAKQSFAMAKDNINLKCWLFGFDLKCSAAPRTARTVHWPDAEIYIYILIDHRLIFVVPFIMRHLHFCG